MKANADWWTTEEERMLYILSTLDQDGTAKKQFRGYMDAQGNLTCCDTTEMLRIMTVSFGDINEDERNAADLLKLHQGSNRLPEFLPEWLALASTSGYNDAAKVNTLKAALHPAIIERLSYYDKALIPSTIDGYITKVREIDALLCSIKGEDYTKLSAQKFTQPIQPSLSLTTPPSIPSTFTDIDGDTTMDLSLIWIPKAGKKPITPEEKKACKEYNCKHNLCFVCDSKDHSATDCPDSFVNKAIAKKAKEVKAENA